MSHHNALHHRVHHTLHCQTRCFFSARVTPHAISDDEYERFDDVRAMEMWEARVDYVFASLKSDPAFVELTKMAR